MTYHAEVKCYETGRIEVELRFRANVHVRPKDDKGDIIAGSFGTTADEAKANALENLRDIILAVKPLLGGNP